MSSIRVSVTAEHIAAGTGNAVHDWDAPVTQALAELTGEQVSIDAGDGLGVNIATIGQDEWTLVIDLPTAANDFLNRRWDGEADGEPFEFEIPVPEWIVRLVGGLPA